VTWLKERKARWTAERLRRKQIHGNIDPRSVQVCEKFTSYPLKQLLTKSFDIFLVAVG